MIASIRVTNLFIISPQLHVRGVYKDLMDTTEFHGWTVSVRYNLNIANTCTYRAATGINNMFVWWLTILNYTLDQLIYNKFGVVLII